MLHNRRGQRVAGVLFAAIALSACRPEGVLERGDGNPSGMHITGWARDPDSPEPIQVHAYVDGVFAASTIANIPRPDVQAAKEKAGPAHGFAIDVPASYGFHEVCIYGIDIVGGDDNAPIGCWPLNVGDGVNPLPPIPDGPHSVARTVTKGEACDALDEGKYGLAATREILRCGRTLIAPLHWDSV